MRSLVEENHCDDTIACDSAGIIDANVGSAPNSTMKYHAGRRGYRLSGIARQLDPGTDFEGFDYIVTMDEMVDSQVRSLAPNADYLSRVHGMTDFCRTMDEVAVPDPYYGTGDDFERVLDILEDACLGLFEQVIRRGGFDK